MHDAHMAHTENAVTALEHVQSVKASHLLLADLYAEPRSAERDRKLGETHNLLRTGLQLAKIHAELATAEQVCRVADAIESLVQSSAGQVDSYTADLMRREYIGGRS